MLLIRRHQTCKNRQVFVFGSKLNRKNLVHLLLLGGERSSVTSSNYLSGSVAHCEQTDLVWLFVFWVFFFFNSILEILQFWRNVCSNVWGRLVLQTEEQRAQLHNSKAEKTEFVILTARS